MNFIFRGNHLLLRETGMDFPDDAVCARLGLAPAALQPVWLSPGCEHHCAHVTPGAEAPEGFAFRALRSVLAELDGYGSLASRAFQVSEWVRTNRYCGVCATAMTKSSKELCFHCPACGFSAYPRISPAMMVLIRRGPQILLARHATYATARYTALAGFVEAGENIEEAIHREVLEEVGLRVGNLRYFGSQSWPFPHSLMIAYTAEYAGGELRIQEDEIADARWFGPGDILPDIPMVESIAGRLVRENLPSGAAA
ncbi:NAD(+) diphosphatase [Castellaniella sp. GW247-6E4]|uniref:NAD(+) diphosphatase n=1 Tax=Castellaniella sp. GW247-6E4 TaxID=3140380 RepID=UPI0033158222